MMHNTQNQQNKPEKATNLKGYLVLWFGQSFSMLGSAIVSFAIIWWLTVTTDSSLILSLATFSSILPMVIFSPIAGVLTDRFNRKFVLLFTDLIQAIATFGLILLFSLELIEVWHILILLAVRGTMQAFQFPASATIISVMVPKEKISRINSLNSIVNSLIFISSPAIGAVALGYFSVQYILWLDVFTFLPAAFILFGIFIPEITTEKNVTGFLNEFKEGLAYIKSSRLYILLAVFALGNIFINPLFSLMPLYIKNVHAGTSQDLALVESLAHVGMLLGSTLLLVAQDFKPNVKTIIFGELMLLSSLLVFAIVPTGNFILLGAVGVFIGISISFIDVVFMSVLQIVVPPDFQGRVFSSSFTLIKGILPFALIGFGVIAETVPLRLIYFTSPLLLLIFMVFILLKTNLISLVHTKMSAQDTTTSESSSEKSGVVVA